MKPAILLAILLWQAMPALNLQPPIRTTCVISERLPSPQQVKAVL